MSIDTGTSDALSAILGEYSRAACYGNVLFGGDLLELLAACFCASCSVWNGFESIHGTPMITNAGLKRLALAVGCIPCSAT